MAITAAITLSSSTAKSEQQVTATCTITNTGTGAINLVSIQPTMAPHSGTTGSTSVALGIPPVGGAFPISIPGSSGTLAVSFAVVAHSPITSYNVGAEPNSFAYDVGATVYTADGSVTAATTATLTVSYPSS